MNILYYYIFLPMYSYSDTEKAPINQVMRDEKEIPLLTASKDLFNVDQQFLRRIFPRDDEKE